VLIIGSRIDIEVHHLDVLLDFIIPQVCDHCCLDEPLSTSTVAHTTAAQSVIRCDVNDVWTGMLSTTMVMDALMHRHPR
jgi:hypothetical protein